MSEQLPFGDLILRDELKRRIPISEKRVAWRRSEIERWLEQRTATMARGSA